jgi:hypothetical protein
MIRFAGCRFGPLLAALLAACAVTPGTPSSSDLAVNKCQSDADCSGGRCVDSLCQGSHGKVTSLLVSVTPSAADVQIANVTFYKPFPSDGGTLNPNGAGRQDINVGAAVALTGTVRVDPGCQGTFTQEGQTLLGFGDGTIPANVTFTPSQRVLGIPTDFYRGTVRGNYTFTASLAPGEYDVYIQPYPQTTDEHGNTVCPVPPRLLLGQTVGSNLDVKLSPGSKLPVQVIWPLASTLAGWVVDLVDANSSRPLSIPRPVRDEDLLEQATDTQTYGFGLDYAPIYAPDAKGTLQPQSIGDAVLRLTPPADVTAPVLMAQLSGAQIGDEPAPAVLRQKDAFPAPVHVELQADLASDGSPVPAVLTLTAEKLSGVGELFTAFSRTVTVDVSGLGAVDLLPGTYRVIATPNVACDPSSCLAQKQMTWVIAESPSSQAGRLVEFTEAGELYGRVAVASGDPAVGATVRAVPSTSILDSNIFNNGDATAPFVPRSAFSAVNSDGDFSFKTDPGTFDVRVEPDSGTGFGWFVRPGVVIDADSGGTDLDTIALPLPIAYTGTVTTGTGEAETPIPSALVRAFVYMNSDGKLLSKATDGAVAVQVAETRTDADGAYTLLLPPDLDRN